MLEVQPDGMDRLTAQQNLAIAGALEFPARDLRADAILLVEQQRSADGRQLNANLVRSSGLRLHPHVCKAVESFDHVIDGLSLPAARMIAANGHLLALVRM